MATGQLLFQPPKFDWHVEDQQITFEEWKGQITLALEASNIQRKMVCYHCRFSRQRRLSNGGTHFPFQSKKKIKRIPNEVFKTIADTLEVSTSYWNHINEMYSDIKQGEYMRQLTS